MHLQYYQVDLSPTGVKRVRRIAHQRVDLPLELSHTLLPSPVLHEALRDVAERHALTVEETVDQFCWDITPGMEFHVHRPLQRGHTVILRRQRPQLLNSPDVRADEALRNGLSHELQ